MSALMDSIHKKAKAAKKRIVLAEGEEERVIRAAAEITAKGIAAVTLVGDEKVIAAKVPGISLKGVDIINPVKYPDLKKFTDTLYQLRKEKGLTEA